MNRVDLRHPLAIDTKELGRRPGNMLTVERLVETEDRLGTEVIGIPAGDPLELDLRLESVMEGVLVSGVVSGTAVGACVRCLEDVRLTVEADIQELFAYDDRAVHHEEVADADDEDEVRVLVGDIADLGPAVRDAVVPALPFQPVCSSDCPGLCSDCGALLADDPGHQHEVLDPRWGALAALRDQADPDETKKRN